MNDFALIYNVDLATEKLTRAVKAGTMVFVKETNSLYKLEADAAQGETVNEILETATRITSLIADPRAATYARPYKVLTALLSQAGENPPTAEIFENTVGGNISFTRDAVGFYSLVSDVDSFVYGSTVIIPFAQTYIGQYGFVYNHIDPTAIEIVSLTAEGVAADSQLNKTPIEIRVYDTF